MRLNPFPRRQPRRLTPRRARFLEQLEPRTLLAAGIIELGASDNIALDQPRVAVELAKDIDPGPGVQWESIGPGLFNTFLLDTGASSVLTMGTAIADIQQSPLGYEVQGSLLEQGVAGDHLLDVSIPYRFDFAGSNGIRHTIPEARIMSDANNDFSSFGPWGLVGMPAMVNRVTSLDFTGWSGGGLDLDGLYMDTEFRDAVPAGDGHRYTISLDNRLSFDPLDQMISGQPPIWGDVPFVTAIPEHNGIAQEGNFLFDTGAQISVISERLAIEIGLDSNGDGTLDQQDTNFVTQQVVGGVGGQIAVPVFGFDEFHLPTDSGEDLVWTNLEWLVLDIETPGAETSLDGVFGSDLLTSGWFHAFFSPGQPDGYINQLHMDFRDMETSGTAKVHFDLNPDVDNVILPGPGIVVRQSFRTTDVGEGGETDSYNIVLTGAPTADVTITLENGDGQVIAENDANGSNTLVFTPQNWETVQTVLVTAVNDVAAEGNHTGLITHTVSSADSGYEGRVVQDVTVRVTDDDLNLLEITSDQAGLNPISSLDVAEAGDTSYYWLALSERPDSEIWVLVEDTKGQAEAVKADNPQLGLENVLMFTSGNWDQPQRVALAAVNDTLKEGPHQAKMIHTVLDVVNFSDPIVGQTPVTVNITDDDLGDVMISSSGGSTNVGEAGATDTYQIALNMVPSSGVEITVQADTQTLISADGGLTFAATQVLNFTNTTAQTITVQAIDDAVFEDTHFGIISHAVTGVVNDSRFPATLSINDVLATITDNDAAGLTITAQPPSSSAGAATSSAAANLAAANLAAGTTLDLSEAGDDTMYWVVLDSQPQADVTVFLSNTDQQVSAVDANHPSNAFLTYNALNWDTPQAVVVNAVNDPTVEGLHTSQLDHHALSADSNYRGSVVMPVSIIDNDAAGMTLSKTSVTVSEDGTTTDSFSVALAAQPLSDVVISVTSGDTGEAVVDKPALTFTTANWDQAQTVNVTGESDQAVDGDQATTITLSVDADASDDAFDLLLDQTVIATTTDNDFPESTPPTADLANPTDGSAVAADVLNAQGYLEVTFADLGDGLDAATIDGDELAISGSGVDTAVLSGTAVPVGGTTYRYAFTGDFADGTVNVEFIANSFGDLATPANLNAQEIESFTVQTLPPTTVYLLDDGDAGFATSGSWTNYANGGYESDIKYSLSGTGTDLASWTFTGLAAGTYEIAAHWYEYSNRASNAPYTIYDDTTLASGPILVNQQIAPLADYTAGGENFQIINSAVVINSGTLVVELSDNADGLVIADAIQIKLVAPAGPDITPPTADLANPTAGSSVDAGVLKAQGYLEVTFADAGDGLDAATIDGDELAISGSGVDTAVLSGTAVPVGGTTYRYAFTGDFADGTVNVEFIANSFGDLATPANLNAQEIESFTVQTLPPTTVYLLDDGDAGFATSGSWTNYASGGYESDIKYSLSGTGTDLASWTFTGLAAGTYEIAAHWYEYSNRASNAPYTIYDDTTLASGPILIDQKIAPLADYTAGGENFQIINAAVVINSGTLVVELSDNADGLVVADAIQIKLVAPAGPDITPPTADLANPTDGGSVDAGVLNAQGYLEVTFADAGDGLDAATIDGDELAISGSGVDTAVLSGTAVLVGGTTYRYAFTGDFADGTVNVEFIANSFGDLATPANLNAQEIESFTIQTLPPSYLLDDGDAGFATSGSWTNYPSGGYESDIKYSLSGTGTDLASWTFTGLAAGTYEIAAHWYEYSNRASNAPYTIYDDTTLASGPILINQKIAPLADYTAGGENFQIINSAVVINSGTLVVELSDNADGLVIADAIQIKLVAPAGPDITPPTADLANPTAGSSVAAGVLNAQGYLEVTFADAGDGLDAATIDGDELAISGSGVDTAVLSGTAVLVGGTTYRYAFTGDFADGTVNVEFIANSFGDLATPANLNAQEIESFTIQTLPPSYLLDDGDAGFATSGSWTNYPSGGYESDIKYSLSGTGTDLASWTFTGLAAGTYEIAAHWYEYSNRASNAPYTIYDDTTLASGPILVNQKIAPLADYTEGGENFQIINSAVIINSGTLVVELSDNADGIVLADAIQIKLVAPASEGEIMVEENAVVLVDGTSMVDFGTTQTGLPVSKVFSVQNAGLTNLALTQILQNDLPTGYTLVSGFGDLDLAFGESTTFEIQLAASSEGVYGGTLSFANNDADENPFEITLQGEVTSGVLFVVNYADGGDEGFNDSALGAMRKAAFEYSLDIWSSEIAANYLGETITIDAVMDPLPSNILGSAGATQLFRDFAGATVSNTWYGSALANHLAGRDLNTNTAEISVTLNSNFGSWYYGIDGQTPSNLWDFATVVVHEIGHGLNFLGLIDGDGSWAVQGLPGIYDTFLELDATGDGTDLTAMNNTDRASAIVSNNLYWNGTNGNTENGNAKIRIYAPSSYSSGSSVSHVNQSTYQGIAVMTPQLASGVSNHQVANLELGMMVDMGWSIPSITGGGLLVAASSVTAGGEDWNTAAAFEFATRPADPSSDNGRPLESLLGKRDAYFSVVEQMLSERRSLGRSDADLEALDERIGASDGVEAVDDVFRRWPGFSVA